ncbi:MAG: NAD(P)/FAD-dependent oxidoreductase [Candidatus Aminicenantales bacterium]
MRVIVVGNGLAGTIFSKTLRELDKDIEIDIFAAEKYHYYPRPNLIEYVAGNLALNKMFAYPEDWYREQKISVHLNRPVKVIHHRTKEVELEGERREKYDYLFLASGSFAFLPPFKGVEKKGVFTLRTLDDALAIMDYVKNHKKVAVIGGGLLGLEIARAVKSRGAEVEVVEYFGRLLPRQLDTQCSSLLKNQMEKMGIKVHLGLTTEEVKGQEEAAGLRFRGGEELRVEMVIIAAGIRPDIGLARKAGLEVDRGLVVDDYLQTSSPFIFAAGDLIQHRGRMYGIIPATFEQARLAAPNILGEKRKYGGTVPWNTLKVAGIYLTSVGLVEAEKETQQELVFEDREKGIYKKIILEDGFPLGAIWMGTKKGAGNISRAVTQRKNIEKWKDSILKDEFDFSVI